MQVKNINPKCQRLRRINAEIADLLEDLDILGKSEDDRPKFMAAVAPNKRQLITSRLRGRITSLAMRRTILTGETRARLTTNGKTIANYKQA